MFERLITTSIIAISAVGLPVVTRISLATDDSLAIISKLKLSIDLREKLQGVIETAS
jgi:hypothetical protein